MNDKRGKLLFVTPNLGADNKYFGGYVVSERNYSVLTELTDVDIEPLKVYKKERGIAQIWNLLSVLARMLFLYSSGLSGKRVREILRTLEKGGYDTVFVDNSLCGKLVKRIKKEFPGIRVISFFHNVEFKFIYAEFTTGRLEQLPRLITAYVNESLTAKYSDICIALTNKEKEMIREVYKRDAEMVIEVSLRSKDVKNDNSPFNAGHPTYLFVGSHFFANAQGIETFVNEVFVHLPGELLIVGKGMENLQGKFTNENIRILGSVNDLGEYYAKADIVVTPLYIGAGMKVKVAEALMYGKYIFGTSVSFEGYELDYKQVGGLFDESKDMVAGIRQFLSAPPAEKYNQYARNVFEEKYANETAVVKFASVLKNGG